MCMRFFEMSDADYVRVKWAAPRVEQVVHLLAVAEFVWVGVGVDDLVD